MDPARQKRKETLIEEETSFEGTLRSTCHVVVHGRLEGQIEAPELSIAASGTVIGHVRASRFRSEGALAGTVEADVVSLSGTVSSNTTVRASTLEVKLSRERHKFEVVFGECSLEVGTDPAVEADPPADSASTPVDEVSVPFEDVGTPANEGTGTGPIPLPRPASAAQDTANRLTQKARHDDPPARSTAGVLGGDR